MEITPGLIALAWVSLGIGFAGALVIAVDILRGRRQKMAIMNWVWPITPLYMGLIGLWAYFSFGRADKAAEGETNSPHDAKHGEMKSGEMEMGGQKNAPKDPGWKTIFMGVTHCGSGCTLGDVAGDWLVFALGLTIAGVAFWPKVIGEFTCAYLFGVVFQFFAIAPMRNLNVKDGIVAAVKADTLSIVSYEIGMLVWMGLTHFIIFRRELPPTQPVYWFSMQIAMLVGFATSYPVNKWLIKKGWKEAM